MRRLVGQPRELMLPGPDQDDGQDAPELGAADLQPVGDGSGEPAHIHIKSRRAERAITFDPMLATPGGRWPTRSGRRARAACVQRSRHDGDRSRDCGGEKRLHYRAD